VGNSYQSLPKGLISKPQAANDVSVPVLEATASSVTLFTAEVKPMSPKVIVPIVSSAAPTTPGASKIS
jgi:hypothetical protein